MCSLTYRYICRCPPYTCTFWHQIRNRSHWGLSQATLHKRRTKIHVKARIAQGDSIRCVGAHLLYSALSRRRLNPITSSIRQTSGWTDQLTASAFTQLDQYAWRTYTGTQNSLFSLLRWKKSSASIQCTVHLPTAGWPLARLSWPGWLATYQDGVQCTMPAEDGHPPKY